jgi:hypothetical protein
MVPVAPRRFGITGISVRETTGDQPERLRLDVRL